MNKTVDPKSLEQRCNHDDLVERPASRQLVPITSPKDPTGAERQKRFRKRRARTVTRDECRNESVTRDGVTLLCDRQDKIEITFNDDGDAILTQSSWPDDDSIIIVSRDNIPQFIDRLTDALGIPSFGGPSR